MVKADVPLSKIFPHIVEIERFNLSISQASEILENSGSHVAGMALPYLLAMHEDYVRSCLGLLAREGKLTTKKANSTPASKMHATMERAATQDFPVDSLSQFHVLREMRNCLTHRGGIVDERLTEAANSLSRGAEAGWKKQTTYAPRRFKEGDPLTVGTGEVVMTLAVVKNLARCANRIIADALSVSTWVDVALEDIEEFGPGIPRNKDERLRKIQGYARHYYAAICIKQEDLEEGLARMGI
ncbi:hypothetical protein [Streptomyces diacarni]|uniref:hypothetical protein n=1 Tax=Streptomyces diacarni TaxID=2800381 RepID=UPI0015F10C77|nr:hypothetical protein [Streptomyces diacarni]